MEVNLHVVLRSCYINPAYEFTQLVRIRLALSQVSNYSESHTSELEVAIESQSIHLAKTTVSRFIFTM